MKRVGKIGAIMALCLTFLLAFSMSAFAATAAPTGVTVTPGNASLSVSWAAVAGAEGYNVYVGGVKHNTPLIAGTSYTVTGLTNGTAYSITVKSYDDADSSESAASSAVSGTPAAPASGAVDFSGTTLPFTVPDMLGTAINFLTMYGEWVLLALGVIFAPVLYGLAMKLVAAAKKRSQA